MIGQPPTRRGKLRFGMFEADLDSGELRKSGIRINLQNQPFRVLAILLQNAGEVVAREDLQRMIWGAETVVDFDHSLGTAVNKVREALNDSADSPRYIETLARRGYRFIAPVQPVEALDGFTSTESPTRLQTATVAQAIFEIPGSVRRRKPLAWRIPVAALLVVIGLVCLFWWALRDAKPQVLHFTQVTSSDSIFPGDTGIERFPVLLTDGTRLYFSTISNGRVVLAYSSISGAEAHPLTTPSEILEPTLADISSDGSKLLVIDQLFLQMERSMWIVPSAGGAARKVLGGLGHDATWMPDGQSILYAAGNSLLVTRNNGQEPRTLVTLPGRAFWLRCAPDGSRVRFTVVDAITRATSLWELAFDGNRTRQLLPGWDDPTSECCGNWTPDGKHYVFQSNRTGTSNIWVLPERTAFSFSSPEPMQITAGPLNYIGALPARRGNQIFLIGAHRRSQLYGYDAASQQFLPYLRGISTAGRTEFSRDGSHVAWVSTSDGSLWQSKLDGSERLQLTSNPMQVFLMRWSPDARKIAFMGKEPGKTWKIYTFSAEGGNPQMVLDEPRSQADPDWSPDGNAIVFGRSSEYMAEDSTPKTIQILDLRTRVLSTLPGSEGLFCPRWSPEGRYIAAMPLNHRKLMVFDRSAGKWTELAAAGGRFNNPVWSKDGKYIYFQSFSEGGSPICRIDVSSGRSETVASFPDLRPGTTVSYWGIAPDSAPIASFNFLTADIYTVDWEHR
jgi:Tol biopolymer transport system component/DNA-binding winged helix-turn-helix (wHTH) protein